MFGGSRDGWADKEYGVALVPQVATDNTLIVGRTISTAGASKLTLGVITGTLADADATFTITVYESDDSGMVGETAVADADLVGTEAAMSFVFSDDISARVIGYKGSKKYIRLKIQPANNTGNAPVAGWFTKEDLRYGTPAQSF